MLRLALRRAAPARALAAAAGPAAAFGGLGGAARWVHASPAASATAGDALSSGKAPTSSPPDSPPGGPGGTEDFSKLADLYLGGLWDKLETGLERPLAEEGHKFDAQMRGDSLRLKLPDGGEILISKDADSRSLVVHSNLHDTYGSDGADSEVHFKLQKDHTWETDGEELHQYLEDGLAKHLKLQVDLEPDAQTQYGPDPT